MRRSMLFLTVILIAIAPAALAGTVRGKVIRADGAPHESAAVSLGSGSGNSSPVYTGRDGMFYIRNVQPGTYTVEVKSPRQTKKFRVTVQAAEYTDLAPIAVN